MKSWAIVCGCWWFAPQEQAPELSERYVVTQVRALDAAGAVLAGSSGPVPVLGDFHQQLAGVGRFARAEAGETLELAALRLGCEPDFLARLNRLPADHVFDEGDIVCLDHRHRLLDDEGLAELAALHDTDLPTLCALNGWESEREAEPWTKVLVPLRIARQEVANFPGAMWQVSTVRPASQDLLGEGMPLSLAEVEECRHEVAAGESWESVAAQYRTDAATLVANFEAAGAIVVARPGFLRDAHSREPPIPVGEEVVVAMTVPVRPDRSPSEIALALEASLKVDLDAVVALNDVAGPEELATLERLWVPLAPGAPRASLLRKLPAIAAGQAEVEPVPPVVIAPSDDPPVPDEADEADPRVPIGAAAPDFERLDHTGKTRRLKDYAGKVLVLEFWGSWCPPCLASLPAVQKLQDRDPFQDRLAVLGVNVRDRDLAQLRRVWRRQRMTLPTLVDSDAVAAAYGVRAYPSTVIVGHDGKVLHAKATSADQLVEEVQAAVRRVDR